MKNWIPVTILLLSLLPLSSFGQEGNRSGTELAKIKLDEKTFNSARRCGECHVDIYKMWQKSLHSKAMKDPAFLAVFKDKRVQASERTRGHCLQCHAPTFHYNPGLGLQSDVAQEGVTCDFCHSIQEMAPGDTKKPFVVQSGKLKRGPYKDSVSPVHETKQSDLFESGELCGGCHEMRNLLGTPIITTYSEWRDGYYQKKGKVNCQGCHMPLAPGLTVTSALQPTKRRINLHSFPGGRSRVQLHDALELRLLEEVRAYGKMTLKFGLTNTGVGHAIPTGNPLRKIVVEFQAHGAFDEILHEAKTEIGRQFGDKNGKALATDVGIFLDAAQILGDNRIGPGETRELVYEFTAPDQKILAEATVWYVYENTRFPKQTRREEVASLKKVVNKEKLE